MIRIVARCSCGRVYSEETWRLLPLVGTQPTVMGGAYTLRNCECMSTRAVCSTCGRDDCGCKGCGCICGEGHEDGCPWDEDVFSALRRRTG